MSDAALSRAVNAAMRPMVVSLGAWGVKECHWLPDSAGEPVVWICTSTELERVSLEAQVWLRSQVQMMLTRVGVPYSSASRVRIDFTSSEARDRLFDE